ncbi:M20/M25/M40 family metallo-hydrolase [archaeon]|jgi:acetylornithine deacetylase/succinyl-diaminopimelate desuccinylase-like protein|nr:M20/M25/M40 family metallo-hydrolase [archaeon]MBT4374002.1 M20/M25/M40 family metallo-hydrolase [archaeon]MBT4532098.1 M20/M25/M40 family metallo-hydrolase [archaeon]MBT7001988.1 M20/M25/M40 family metallo-hydrolase [archaeon]MBT7282699.1 M20/M25/M40 family metallo-hydrolase [archaeon]
MTEAKNLLLDLLKFDTQNSDEFDNENLFRGETIEALKFIEIRLKKIPNIKTEITRYDLENYVGTIKETFTNRGFLIAHGDFNTLLPNILFQGHIDTVPFGEFPGNPLGEFDSNLIRGRGACDMKGSLTGMILAFEKLVNNSNRKFNPILLITSDEEARNFAGIKKFISQNTIPIEFAICGEPSNFQIFNKFKGVTSRAIKIKGKAAHGARPQEGINAIIKSNQILTLLEKYANELGKNPEPIFKSDSIHSQYSTLNVGKISGGIKVNAVPSTCLIEFEMRLVKPLSHYENELEEQIFSQLKETDYKLIENFSFNPLLILEQNNPLLKNLKKSIEKEIGEVREGVMEGFSEATLLNLNEICTIVFGPGDLKYAHSSEEQIPIADIEKYIDILVDFGLNTPSPTNL